MKTNWALMLCALASFLGCKTRASSADLLAVPGSSADDLDITPDSASPLLADLDDSREQRPPSIQMTLRTATNGDRPVLAIQPMGRSAASIKPTQVRSCRMVADP